MELLAEYKAEIVEEEITDLPEEGDVSIQKIYMYFLSHYGNLICAPLFQIMYAPRSLRNLM